MTFPSSLADRLNTGSSTDTAKRYEIVEDRATTVRTITANEPLTGHTVTFRWEGEALPTHEDLARLFAQVRRMRTTNAEAARLRVAN